jgi:hypothetical protein
LASRADKSIRMQTNLSRSLLLTTKKRRGHCASGKKSVYFHGNRNHNPLKPRKRDRTQHIAQ